MSEAMAPPWTMVPTVTSAPENGRVSIARPGWIAVSCIPRWVTYGEVGKNWRMKSAPESGCSMGVLIRYLLTLLACQSRFFRPTGHFSFLLLWHHCKAQRPCLQVYLIRRAFSFLFSTNFHLSKS